MDIRRCGTLWYRTDVTLKLRGGVYGGVHEEVPDGTRENRRCPGR